LHLNIKLFHFTPCSLSSSQFQQNFFLFLVIFFHPQYYWHLHLSFFSGEIFRPPVHHGGFFAPAPQKEKKSRSVVSLYTFSPHSFLQPTSPVSGWMVFLACGQMISERPIRPELTPLWSTLLFYFMLCESGGLFA